MGTTDVFEAGFGVPERVVIVAPGRRAYPEYENLTREMCKIAVNRAILIPRRFDLWVCADVNLVNYEWFREANQQIIASGRRRPVRVFSEDLAERGADCDYTFKQNPSLNYNDCAPMRGVLRCGATVTAQAVQLAYFGGARRIELCGADFEGRVYFNGHEANYPDRREESGWPGVRRFAMLVENLDGVRVVSRTETRLAVERV